MTRMSVFNLESENAVTSPADVIPPLAVMVPLTTTLDVVTLLAREVSVTYVARELACADEKDAVTEFEKEA